MLRRLVTGFGLGGLLMLGGCASSETGVSGAVVKGQEFRLIARGAYSSAVRSHFSAQPLLQPSLAYRAGWVFGLEKDSNNITFASGECNNLFTGGLRASRLSDVTETSIISSGSDVKVLSDLFGAGYDGAREARVQVGIRGVQEEVTPPRSLQKSLFNPSCVAYLLGRFATAKAENRKLRIFVVMRSLQAEDLFFDISFKSAVSAKAALAVLKGSYSATGLNEFTLRVRPNTGINLGNQAVPFATNDKDIQEIVPMAGGIGIKAVS